LCIVGSFNHAIFKHQHIHLCAQKAISASAGEFTIGSFSLKEVLSRIGKPVFFPECFNKRIIAGGYLLIHCLQATGAVSWVTAGIAACFSGFMGKYLFHKRHFIRLLNIRRCIPLK